MVRRVSARPLLNPPDARRRRELVELLPTDAHSDGRVRLLATDALEPVEACLTTAGGATGAFAVGTGAVERPLWRGKPAGTAGGATAVRACDACRRLSGDVPLHFRRGWPPRAAVTA